MQQSLTLADRFALRLGEILSWLFGIATAVTVFEVVSRYLFSAPTIWAHESTIALSALGFIFGGGYALARDDHIRITTVYLLAGPRLKLVLDWASIVCGLFYLSILAWAGTSVADRAWQSFERSGSAWNPPTPTLLKTALVIGALLMLVQMIAKAVALATRGPEQAGER